MTSIELSNDLSELERLATLLREIGGRLCLSSRLVGKLNLVLEEIVTNIIEYGFDDAGAHKIRIDLELADDLLTARIEDDGRPFDPMSARDPDVLAPLDERPVGGLGILLVKTLMDDVVYSRNGGRNVLLLTKRLRPGHDDDVEHRAPAKGKTWRSP